MAMKVHRYEGLLGYEGLSKHGYEGLYIVDTTALSGPVHIMRQFVSNLDTLISAYTHSIDTKVCQALRFVNKIVKHSKQGTKRYPSLW